LHGVVCGVDCLHAEVAQTAADALAYSRIKAWVGLDREAQRL